ncbi:MAG: glycosyltransferase [Gemmatimonadetes bacterium]|nr:MAG: glycosyltransferase [Gemmatimonadota bacterium]
MLTVYLWGFSISSSLILYIALTHLIRLQRSRTYPPTGGFRVSVLIPCKGNDDPDFENNLSNITRQHYDGDVEFIFCAESETDSAVPVIRRIAQTGENIRVCIAGLAEWCSQKTYNILKGMELANHPDIFVIADADIQPHPTWLQEMIAPFGDDQIGATTGFFRRIPMVKKFRMGDYVAGIFAAFINVGMTNDSEKPLWGGSLALRKSMMDAYNLYERLGTEIVDDIAIMHALRQHNIRRKYIPSCTLKSYCDMSLKNTIEWFIRQTQFSQIYLKVPYVLYYVLVMPLTLWILLLPVVLGYGVVAQDSQALMASTYVMVVLGGIGYIMRKGVPVNPASVDPEDPDYNTILWMIMTPITFVLGAWSLLQTLRRVKNGVLTMVWRHITYKVDVKTGKVLEVIRE